MHWWRIFSKDPHWVPPYYPIFRRELEPAKNSHLRRLEPAYIYDEALPISTASRQLYKESSQSQSAIPFQVTTETSVAAGIALTDPRRADASGYLALLHVGNDAEALERFLFEASEILAELGCQQIIAPTGLSPHLGSGLLVDHWNLNPPLYTPYQPPYMAEIFSGLMQPFASSRLYHIAVNSEGDNPSNRSFKYGIQFEAFTGLGKIIQETHLLISAFPEWAGFAPPDREEIDFILRWVSHWKTLGWVALREGRAVGFILLQPDLSAPLRAADGGKKLLYRFFLNMAGGLPTKKGRILLGGVLPEWRGRGIGSELFHRAVSAGREQGWQEITVGPLPAGSEAAPFFEDHGAAAMQTYTLYNKDIA